jgi:predicted aspartyl protease
VPVAFINGDESFETTALLDSGADITAMNQEMAEVLGLDLSGKRELCYGVTGHAEAVLTKVKISIGKNHEHYTMVVPVKVLLTENMKIPLLGQVGFFDEFKITFDKTHQKVTLVKVTNGGRRSRRESHHT